MSIAYSNTGILIIIFMTRFLVVSLKMKSIIMAIDLD